MFNLTMNMQMYYKFYIQCNFQCDKCNYMLDYQNSLRQNLELYIIFKYLKILNKYNKNFFK